MTPIKKIGFIGVGHMGSPMAGQLVKKGFDVTAFDLREGALHSFVAEHGGRTAATLADAGRGVDAVIFMLPDDKVVRQVLFGDGLAGHLARGAVAIDMSSSAPAGTVAIGNELAQRGIGYVDAPVMGGVVFAKDATLDIMAGGDPALVERLFDKGYKARPERAILFTIEAWDVNCSSHIVTRFTETEIEQALATVQAKIAELEAENARLHAALAQRSPSEPSR